MQACIQKCLSVCACLSVCMSVDRHRDKQTEGQTDRVSFPAVDNCLVRATPEGLQSLSKIINHLTLFVASGRLQSIAPKWTLCRDAEYTNKDRVSVQVDGEGRAIEVRHQ